MSEELMITEGFIVSKILLIRGQKVMLDSELAILYGVETKQLKRQVRRNIERFPEDFMFELTEIESEILRSQIGTSSWGGIRYVRDKNKIIESE
ncbi:ORF6N domain-containing protein [Flavobacterium sp. N1736]|uniref:ORF6N domain-containing protein n=1 Tax=Flavobacterium sp. N1736 TaxID=2986823 RepID=UPI0022242653|nr:ORF6N domain-containing protein [Flavobacterium sp. N1736]